ncbi:AAA family ATPase, partial [Cytobacillus pseudoceanisediminis]|uniref:AAA family ATPase n=1 Tax=Cytobacillus pseudoceanisediminis TaxID=3051614 RepID=UPI003653EF7F
MRISKLIIENFRCYYGKHTFLLDNDITILFGDNGFGKSSFFDAIEWCLTGSINRFISNDKKILYNFLAKTNQICSVIIEFNNGTSLVRSFKIQENMRETVKLIDEDQNVICSGPKSVEHIIEMGESFQTNKKDLLNTSSLIKQSLILSQDQITDFVLRDEPKERFNALADIMGYKQLTTTLNNLKKIKDKLNLNIRNKQPQITTYKKLISEQENELQEVDIFTVNGLLRKLNLPYSTELTDLIREKKSMLDVEISNCIRNSEVLSDLSHLNDLNFYDYSANVGMTKQDLFMTVSSRNKAHNLFVKINNKKIDLNGRLNKTNKEMKLLEEKERNEEKIHNIKKQISVQLTIENDENKDFDENLRPLETKFNQISYAINLIKQYKKYIKETNLVPLQIVEQELKLGKLKKQLRLVNKKINKFNIIVDKKDESS